MTRSSLQKVLLWASIILYFSLFSTLACLRHIGLKTTMNNLGNMMQPIYNTTQGKFMYSSNFIVNASDTSRFAIHANFIFLLFVPLYAAIPEPMLLLIVQTAVIASGALPLYFLGKRILGKSSWLSLLGPYIYLLSPAVHDVNLYDFHAIALAMPLFIWTFYCMYVKKYGWFIFFAILCMLTKEDAPLIIAAMGVWMFLFRVPRKLGLFTFLAALTYFLVINQIVMPYFGQGKGNVFIAQRYAYLGSDPLQIALNLLKNPWLLVQSIISVEKIWYLIILVFPVAFFALLKIDILLISLPSVLINLLSTQNFAMYYPFGYYYSAPILPFVFISTLFALAEVKKRMPSWVFKLSLSLVLISTALYSLLVSPVPYSFIALSENFSISENAKKLKDVKSLIPQEASLSVQNNLGAHFAHREHIYTFPFKTQNTEYVLLDAYDQYPRPQRTIRVQIFTWLTQMTFQDYFDQVNALFADQNFGVVYTTDDGYILFKRGAPRDNNLRAKEIFMKNLQSMHAKNYADIPLSMD